MDDQGQQGGDALATATAERDSAVQLAEEQSKRADDAERQRDAAVARASELEQERDRAENDAAAAGKRADDAETALKVANDKAAKAKAPAAPKPTTPRARKVAEMPVADRTSLSALFQFPGPFEIVPAHDGKEVTTLNPVEVTGDQFLYAGGLHKLTTAVTYQPDVASVVDGFGLFGTDGKQVAWMPLPEPVTIAARQTVSFADAIGFPSQAER